MATYLTGYAQVLEQWSASATEYLLYDGHGSTRQVVSPASAIVDAFSYDAYGVMLGGNLNPAGTRLARIWEEGIFFVLPVAAETAKIVPVVNRFFFGCPVRQRPSLEGRSNGR